MKLYSVLASFVALLVSSVHAQEITAVTHTAQRRTVVTHYLREGTGVSQSLQETSGILQLATVSRTYGTLQQPAIASHDLVKLTDLDPRITLDIRYATSNNFVHRAVYDRAVAYLQRPAAEALRRANDKLHGQGLGLVVYDGYRPLAVTRMFWNVTPADKKIYVANPASGSRHNRGCAVDLSLIDLATSRPVPMPSGFDDFSNHAWHSYAGGTAESRENRKTLKNAMEAEGFVANATEWWHYDYKSWQRFPVLDVGFDELERRNTTESLLVSSAHGQETTGVAQRFKVSRTSGTTTLFYAKGHHVYSITLPERKIHAVSLNGLPPKDSVEGYFDLLSLSANRNPPALAMAYRQLERTAVGLYAPNNGKLLGSPKLKGYSLAGNVFYSPDSKYLLTGAINAKEQADAMGKADDEVVEIGSIWPAVVTGKTNQVKLFDLPAPESGLKTGWSIAGWLSNSEFLAVAKNAQICNVVEGRRKEVPLAEFFGIGRPGEEPLQPRLVSFDGQSSITIAVGARESTASAVLLQKGPGTEGEWRRFASLAHGITAMVVLPSADEVAVCLAGGEDDSTDLQLVSTQTGDVQLLVEDVNPGILATY